MVIYVLWEYLKYYNIYLLFIKMRLKYNEFTRATYNFTELQQTVFQLMDLIISVLQKLLSTNLTKFVKCE